MGLRILVVGSGGREHALLWKIAQSPKAGALFCAPGNAGTSLLAENLPVRARDVGALTAAAVKERIDLAVIGPEAPLAAGVSDALNAAGIPVFGPSKAAAQIESSKTWAKELMRACGVPTARSIAARELVAAITSLDAFEIPVVIKADGLAAGTGAVVAESRAEARLVLTALLEDDALGAAGRTVIIEERLKGPEFSIFAVTDGEGLVMLPPVRDFKRLHNGNRGPNTAGMGSTVTPKPLDAATMRQIERTIMRPVIDELANRGAPFRGVLYAGIMLTVQGPAVLEFNARFGDPEAQVLLPVLDVDLAELCLAAASGTLADFPAVPTPLESAAGVVLTSCGYPGPHKTGRPIEGTDHLPDDVLLFHGATRRDESGRLLTSGGRVLTVVGLAQNPEMARAKAYAAAEAIAFEDAHYRRDIG